MGQTQSVAQYAAMHVEIEARLAQTNSRLDKLLNEYRDAPVENGRKLTMLQRQMESLTNQKSGYETHLLVLHSQINETLHRNVKIGELAVKGPI